VRLGLLLFAAFVAILLVSFSYPASLVAARLRIVYLESAEEPLADTANILAALAGEALERGDFKPDALYDTASRVAARELSAQIYEVLKERVDLDVYITDKSGKVLFDSRGRQHLGADFSRWRDVSLTLEGRYGARVGGGSGGDPSLPRVLYVAAPIMVHGAIAGSLTVAKPTTSVSRFLQSVRPRLIMLGLFAVGCATTLAFVMSLWLTEQLRRLIRYADDVREGRRVPFPKLARTELLQMGLAFERMRVALAGQAYIEQYVRALTHEIKSPISAIRGAAEILETPALEPAQRARFLGNIQHESLRIQDLVDRMLELSELEVRRALPERTDVALGAVVRTILEALQPMLAQKQLRVSLELEAEVAVRGDPFLLHMALSNLIKNAVEFSPSGGCVRVRCRRQGDVVGVEIEDEGPGIPEFAKERIFERFYSLARPDTGKKSTGLGLNFVKEIAALHHGEVQVENREGRGLRARLTLPAA
jgi:two-component system sensor histidine kinase CreC